MIAEVAVFGFTVKPTTFTYQVPPWLSQVKAGSVVEVPFGKSSRTGVVTSVSDSPPTRAVKEIQAVKAGAPLLTTQQLKLANWMASFYFISAAEALHLMLPRWPKISTLIDQSINKPINQELMLFPTFKQAQAAQKKSGGTLFSHALPVTQFGTTWDRVSSGQTTRVLGTRSALFAPFTNLTRITIFQPESDLYKEERRPYYRSLEVAAALSKIWKATVIPVSYSPRVQDHFRWPHLIKKLPHPFSFELVSLRQNEIVNDKIKTYLSKSGARQLVFLNRKSEKGPLVCRTCKVRSFVLDPSVCPNCGSADVKFQLFNLSTLEKKIRSLVETSAQFATQQIFFQDSAGFDQIIVLSADTYLSQANYDSSEKTYQMITLLLRLLNPNGRILVQTAHPDERSLASALKGDYLSFYTAELKERKETLYPPFTNLAKLTYFETVPADLKLPDNLETFGPFGEGGKHPYWIVRGTDLSVLQDLGRPWKIDLDPLHL